MGRLACDCLNVQIHTKADDCPPKSPEAIGIDPNLFDGDVCEVDLHLEGVRVVHPYLVRKLPGSCWLVHRCLNCGLYTHAIDDKQSRVIVNASLMKDPSRADTLAKSTAVSPLYKVIVSNREDSQPVRDLGVGAGDYEVLQQILASIQQQLNTFLVAEEGAMEKRVTEYQEAQRQKYSDLQSKVRKEKNSLINLILAAERDRIRNAEQELAAEEAKRKKQSPERPLAEEPAMAAAPRERRLTRMESITKRKSSTADDFNPQRRSSLSPDDLDGNVFDFDPAFQEDSTQPFYTSEDDADDTDDSSSAHGDRGNNKDSIYSASVPISMPIWKPANRSPLSAVNRPSYDDEDDFEPAPDPENMAASIKALAQSVHGDGTEIFGDLPTRRTRTRGIQPEMRK
ncbi:hypothetical protein CAPTEDRAFT_189266 [Capitella teleta]|uniref:Uncharacterized protein n=1 Tax=Capitella teleta TaxID=283909 RepID=R7UTC8_CAPTE|nr:hypothetical protein CAPTEDRAFT_189266 [Capitella teleta]|eukprot:ELU06631.1 hypothetical protein CAPTEDRAFT_189266 [Capitella teleta]